MSESLSLAGTWQFQLDPDGTLAVDTLQPDRTITVPLPWQAAFPELQRYSGYAWYQRTITVDDTFVAEEALLHFGAVDYWCQVWVNGTLVGEHEGGYTPFEFLIGSLLKPGDNTLTVRVYDSTQEGIVSQRWPDFVAAQRGAIAGPPFDPRSVPHGKQEWYIAVGGIWQDVTLTPVPRAFVERVHVTPDLAAGSATVAITIGGDLPVDAGATVQVTITGADGAALNGETQIAAGQGSGSVTISIPNPRLWTLDDPHLYTVTTTLGSHTHTTRFGMRSFGYRDGQFLLNDQPLYLLSALDQDLYPDTVYTVPSDEFLRDQFRKAKELGLNNLRCHIKPPDPRYLDLADEMGLLVWAEIPSWRTFWIKGTQHEQQVELPPEVRARVEYTLEEMIARDFNHPSLVIWTLVNEDWGTALPLSAADRSWLSGFYDRCKALDPTRLVVDNSPCGGAWSPNIHVKSDIDDFHVYNSIPDNAASFVQFVKSLALRPLWTYSAHGDTQRRGDEPLMISEFGNWGQPSLAALRAHYGGEIPWIDLGPWWSDWGGEPGWPLGVEERFEKLGLGAIWGDYETFARATQMHQFEAMKFEIEAMRREPTLAGYVITEFTDAYWESNGLLDFARNPKAYHDIFKRINDTDVIVPWVERTAFWADERCEVAVHVSHFSGGASDGATLRWQVENGTEGQLTLEPLPRGTTRQVCTLRLALPAVESTTVVPVTFTLHGAKNGELTSNVLDLTVYPQATRNATLRDQIAVISTSIRSDIPLIDESGDADEASGAATEPKDVGGSEGAVAGSPPSDTPLIVPSGAEGRSSAEFAAMESLVLSQALMKAGYQVSDNLGSDRKIAISAQPDADLLGWVREGGDLLYLCEGTSPFFWAQGRGGAYGGNWVTSYSWVKPEVHPRLAPINPLGLAYVGVMPRSTIVGLPLDDPTYHGDILAGMIVGWVQHPAAHTVQFRYGRGRVVMTTFRIRSLLGTNPTATAMLHDLLDYLHSDRCQPVLKANY